MANFVDADKLKAWITANQVSGVVVPEVPVPPPTPTPPPTPPPTPTPPPPFGKAVVFEAPFTDPQKWVAGRTWSYPNQGKTARQGGDNKLDLLNVNSSRNGHFYARRQPNNVWLADLLTTENAPGGEFRVRPGDELTARVTLFPQKGAWPAIWTGAFNQNGAQPGNGEVDLFEYHGENANILEITNHVRSAGFVWRSLQHSTPFDLRTVFGLNSVDTYINGVRIFSDNKGVPSTWSAALIVNMSVSAGGYNHPVPDSSTNKLSFNVSNLKVWR